MKPDWQEYPLGLILAATRSSVGGMATLVVALCLGTQIGFWALDGYYQFPVCSEDWLSLAFCFLGPICLSCLALWGFLYVLLIAWFGFLLIHQEAPRLRTGAFIVFPQFMCTIITIGVLEDFDTATVLRLLITTPLVLLFSAMPCLVDWRRRRKTTLAS